MEKGAELNVSMGQEHDVNLRYNIFVVIIALLGYAFACTDAGLFGVALPAVAKGLHITGPEGEYIMSIGMALSVIAGLFIGPLSDRFGRRKLLQIVLLFTGLFSALTAVVTSFVQLLFVRALATIGLDNVGPANTLVSEESIPKLRGTFMGIMQAGYPIGMAFGGTIAAFYLPDHWRILFVIVFIPAIIVTIAAFWLREPKDFQEIKTRQHSGHSRSEWVELFKKEYRHQTWVLLLYTFLINGGIAAQATYFVLYINSHNHIGMARAAALFGITGYIAVASQILVGILADRWPAKYFLIGLPLAGSVGIFLLMGSGGYEYVFLGMAIYALFGNGIYGCLIRYMSESFPARLRGTAITGIIAIANINFIIIPLIGGLLMAAGTASMAMLTVGVMLVIASMIMPFGRMIRPGQLLHSVAGE